MTVNDSDREFLLKLLNSMLNIKEQFELDLRKVVGPPYYMRKGNLEVIDSVCQKIRDHLALGLEDQINGTEIEIVTDPNCSPSQKELLNEEELHFLMDQGISGSALQLWIQQGVTKSEREELARLIKEGKNNDPNR